MIDIEPSDSSMVQSAGMFIYSHAEVDQDLSYLTTFEDEVTELQHYLPGCNIDWFNHTDGVETFSSLEGINIESFSSALEYDHIKFDADTLDLYLAQEGEETKNEDNRKGLHGTDKKVVKDFSLQLTREEIADTEAADKVSNWSYGTWGKSCLGNIALESHSSHFQERGGHSETSDFSSSRSCSGKVDGLDLFKCGETSKIDERKRVCLSSASSSGSAPDSTGISDYQFVPDVLITQNTVGKLTTEEQQEQNSNYHHRKGGPSSKNARARSPVVISLKQNSKKGLDNVQLVCEEGSLEGSCIDVPFGLPVQKRLSRKVTSLVSDFDDYKDNGDSDSDEDSDMEISADTHDDGRRRKKAKKRRRHRRWTSSEVIKLIEGVTEHGVGKWTHIKKSLFSSSSSRTSVNLKDKWRNLLKASSNKMLQRREVVEQKQTQTQASLQLPESVWHRVRELAVMYSYPRESKTTESHVKL